MLSDTAFDDELARRLPLPLAQLYRRAHNAKTPRDRHDTAYCLWEAALKLLSSTAIVVYAERGEPAPEIAEQLEKLARPALGHWWGFARSMVSELAKAGDPGFRAVGDLLLGRARDDLPRAAGLEAALREALKEPAGARVTVKLRELFDWLVRFRNAQAHGALGQLPDDFYGRVGRAMLLGVAEVLGRLDVLAGRRLIAVADVRRQAAGSWLIERFELIGEGARRLESLELPAAAADRLPSPERLYLEASDPEPATTWSLHPLVLYNHETAEVFFLNSRRGQRRTEYLCYSNGQKTERQDLGGEQRALLARVLNAPVDDQQVQQWAAKSQAEEEPAPADEGPPRRRLGEFELLSELGRGGMGVVYRAWQPSLDREVALKCTKGAGDSKAEKRFNREIHALGRVEHPHLVKVFTSGSEADQWFYAMELVEGATLGAVCNRLQGRGSSAAEVDLEAWQASLSTACQDARAAEKPPSTPDEAARSPRPSAEAAPTPVSGGREYVRHVVELVRQVAEAAHALHEAGVIHRDIKPDNVMVTPDGTKAVLMDLGLAQLADEAEGRLTRTRQFVGTLRYASPQHVLSVPLDRRTDVYSLGATLWELLTLRPLYGATEQMPTHVLMEKIQREDPERLRLLNPRVPKDLEAVVSRALEKDQSRRYATAQELADDLSRWLRGEPVRARPVGRMERTWRWCRRNPMLAGSVSAVAAALVAVACISALYAADRDRYARKIGRLNRDLAAQVKQTENALEQSDERRKELVEANDQLDRSNRRRLEVLRRWVRFALNRGLGLCEEGESAQGMLWLAYCLEMADTPGLADADTPGLADMGRTARISLASWSRQSPPLRAILDHRDSVDLVAISPDGKEVLTTCPSPSKEAVEARIWNAESGQPLGDPFTHPDRILAASFSPDGRTLLVGGRDGTARLRDVARGRFIGDSLEHQGMIRAVAFRPDGRVALTGGDDAMIRSWDVGTGGSVGEPIRLEGKVRAFGPDAKVALTGVGDEPARLWDLATGKPIGKPLREKGQEISSMAFSKDGEEVLIGCTDRTARLFSVREGTILGRLPHQSEVTSVAIRPDGHAYLTADSGQTARLWSWISSDQQAIEPPMLHKGGIVSVAFSPDSKFALTGSGNGTARLWDAATALPFGPPLAHTGSVGTAMFSPDGKTILTKSGRSVRLWDLPADSPPGPAPQESFAIEAVACSPDGRRFLIADHFGVKTYDAETNQPTGLDIKAPDTVLAAAFSPDSRMILTGDAAGSARLWNAADGSPVGSQPMGHQDSILAVAFSPDGRTVATAGKDRTVRLWSVPSGAPIGEAIRHPGHVHSVSFSPDSTMILTGCRDGSARRWDVATQRAIGKRLRHQYSVEAVAFSPDGQSILTGDSESAHLWDVAREAPIGPPLTQAGLLECAAFSPDGSTIALGGTDKASFKGEVRFWDVATGKPLGPALPHPFPVGTLAFHPDGGSLFTGCAGGRDDAEGEAKRWISPSPVGGRAERISLWVQVLTAMELDVDGDGDIHALDTRGRQERQARLERLGGPPALAPQKAAKPEPPDNLTRDE